jgi:hypothetical protein
MLDCFGVVRRAERLDALTWLCRATSPLTEAALPAPAALWPEIIARADAHLLLPELKLALDRLGLTAEAPAEAAAFLDAVYQLNCERNALLRLQMTEISHALSAVGVTPVWLKGAAELLDPGWERSGRMMQDIDLWIPCPQELEAALQRLDDLGYVIMPGYDDDDWGEAHHTAPRINDRWPVRVEPHRYVIERALAPLLPDREAADALETVFLDGAAVKRLSPRHRASHALVQVTVMAVPPLSTGRTPLMKSLDVVRRLAADFAGETPDSLRVVLSSPQWGGTVAPAFTLMERLFALPNPFPADESALRRLYAVTAHPRLAYLREMTENGLIGRLTYKVLNPGEIPKAIWRLKGVMLGGRDIG